MIRTVIVEDNTYMRNHLVDMITGDGRFLLVAAVADAAEAETLCAGQRADLVLMDVQTLHNHSGLSAGEKIRAFDPQVKVVAVTSLIDPQILQRAKDGAADSLWYKDHGSEELIDVILRTVNGEHIFPDAPPSVELKEMFSDQITPRQMEILRRFVQGMTYDEIAEETGLSKNGVRWHLDQIVEKGGFCNKHELLAALIESKVIVPWLVE